MHSDLRILNTAVASFSFLDSLKRRFKFVAFPFDFDIRGSVYGLLAAHPLAPLVSLHHLDNLEPLFPNHNQTDSLKSINRAYQADPPRIFQQTFCHDYKRKWSISIAWGYTVQLYTLLLPAKDLQTPVQTFKTWRSWSDGPFTFNTRPAEPDPCKQPIVFMLEKAEGVGSNESLTSYTRLVHQTGKTCNTASYALANSVQRILVSSLKMGPDYWRKAPRRYCCELMNEGRIKKSRNEMMGEQAVVLTFSKISIPVSKKE
ncbi:hypothetical protein OIU76_013272 [Salix suchowensis]|nr:hypothetical protein OIU76_013272 [Salix suchowensis]